jgi:hypothetical protein
MKTMFTGLVLFILTQTVLFAADVRVPDVGIILNPYGSELCTESADVIKGVLAGVPEGFKADWRQGDDLCSLGIRKSKKNWEQHSAALKNPLKLRSGTIEILYSVSGQELKGVMKTPRGVFELIYSGKGKDTNKNLNLSIELLKSIKPIK